MASLIKIPSFAPFPTPTIMAVGVASPRAQGQAMTKIPTNETSAYESACAKPKYAVPITSHAPSERKARTMTIGTNTDEILSASFWMGARLPCASSTILIMWASSVSDPTFVALNVNDPVVLIVPATTVEKLHKVNIVVVDKTGTITKGKPQIVHIQNTADLSDEKIISLLAALENKSEHPIAHAVLEYAKAKGISFLPVSNFEIIKGKGLKAVIENVEYFAGNTKLISDLKLSFDLKRIELETLQGKTPVILATSQKVLGVVMVADAIKPEAKEAVKNLHKLGIKTVMLTGDHKNTAFAIAREVGIDDVVAEVLPDEKLTKIKELQLQGHIVAMAGDGINDAPALAQADVGIAMATGTDVAIETAGITLLGGDISKLVKAIRLSRITMRGIKQNLFWAFIYNIIGIPLAGGLFFPIFGWLLNPIFAGLAMAFSSVSVVGNSLRLKAKKI